MVVLVGSGHPLRTATLEHVEFLLSPSAKCTQTLENLAFRVADALPEVRTPWHLHRRRLTVIILPIRGIVEVEPAYPALAFSPVPHNGPWRSVFAWSHSVIVNLRSLTPAAHPQPTPKVTFWLNTKLIGEQVQVVGAALPNPTLHAGTSEEKNCTDKRQPLQALPVQVKVIEI